MLNMDLPTDWTKLAIEVLCLRPVLGGADNGRFGTGFAVRRGGALWLVTCAHNVEDEAFGLRAGADYPMVTLLRPDGPTIDVRDGRRVVFASVDGGVADCVTIEVTRDELPEEVWVFQCGDEADGPLQFTGRQVQAEVVNGAGLSTGVAASSVGHLAIVGFARDPTVRVAPTVVTAHELPDLPRVRPYMLAYAPGALPGMSGSPILHITKQGFPRVTGIHTHNYSVRNMLAGTTSKSMPREDLLCGGGVPFAVILAAIEAAHRGGIQLMTLGVW